MQKKLTKLAFLLVIPFLFTACFGGDEEATTETAQVNKIAYSSTDFTISVPQDWEIVERDGFTSNVPLEAVVVFRNNIKSDIFTATVNVSKVTVSEELGLVDFAKSSLASVKNSLVAFQEISNESYTLTDETLSAHLLEFEGKRGASDPVVRFSQIHVLGNGSGYTITASYLPTEDESVVKNIEEMLNSFSLN